MKKGILIAVFALIAVGQTQAQVTFMPGIRAGVNFAHFTQGNNNYYSYNADIGSTTNNTETFSSKTDFYVGLDGAIKLSKYYTLQPEISYSRQGSYINYTNSYDQKVKTKLDVSYLSLGVINKFTFGKANFHVGPSIDFVVDKGNSNNYTDIDFAFTAGLGYNFTKNIGIEARIKKGIIPVLDYSDYNHDNVVFQLGIAYSFDIKYIYAFKRFL